MTSEGPSGADEDAGVDDFDPASEPLEVSGLWFFLPLPHSIGLPHGWRSVAPKTDAEVDRFDDLVRGVTFRSSLVVHQLTPHMDPFSTATAELLTYASAVMADVDPSEAPPEIALLSDPESPLRPGVTVMEVMVPETGVTEEEIEAALDVALEHVRRVQRAVAVATQEPIRLIARETLPISVPTFRATAFKHIPGQPVRKPEVEESVLWFVPRSAPPAALGVAAETYDDETLAKLDVAHSRALDANPFFLYTDLRREAFVQRYFDGNPRMTLLALATSGEVLLDTILMSMLWEEHVDPAEVVAYFDRKQGHTARVARFIAPRIGGGWDASAVSPAGDYLRNLVRLRHRVIHAGHNPTGAELDTAWAALFALEHYLGDRLAADPNLRKYTRTAVGWMGDAGLRKRDRFTRHVKTLMDDETEPNWDTTFATWRRHVDRQLDPAPPPPGRDHSQVMAFAELLEDSTIRWSLYDESTLYGAVVEASDVAAPAQIESFLRSVDAVQAEYPDRDHPIRSRILGPQPPPADTEWQPAYELFPDLGIFPGTRTPSPPDGLP